MAVMTAHGRVKAGSSQGVDGADDISVTTSGGVDGSQAADKESMDLSDTAGTGDLGGVAVTSI